MKLSSKPDEHLTLEQILLITFLLAPYWTTIKYTSETTIKNKKGEILLEASRSDSMSTYTHIIFFFAAIFTGTPAGVQEEIITDLHRSILKEAQEQGAL
ncbi:MAG: hypothetical protein RIF32_12825 [Leptospirales bacterium]|jgi:hypothetical protein